VRHHLAIFDFAGRHLGSVELPVGSQVNNKHFYVSPTTEHIFIAATEPFPQVEEFELVER